MKAQLFLLLKNFAWFRRLAWKPIYNYMARTFPMPEWSFMNYGYIPDPDEEQIFLEQSEFLERYPLQLYHYLANKIEVEDKYILEVGSGRGGGAKHIAENLHPASYIGMDIAQDAVKLANTNNSLSNLKFIQGSAESIPLKDNSVDVVLNVESCHAYGSVEKFLSEVSRVLKPGGYLLLTDVRDAKKMYRLQMQLMKSGLRIRNLEDITQNVVQAIEADNTSKWNRIRHQIPAEKQKLFAEFAGVVGSKIHLGLKSRKRIYYRFVLQKEGISLYNTQPVWRAPDVAATAHSLFYASEYLNYD